MPAKRKRKARADETPEEREAREAAERVQAEEAVRRKQDALRAELLARAAEDAAAGTALQVDDAWRHAARRAKLSEVRADAAHAEQWFERQLSRSDAALQAAQAESEQLEEMFREAFRAHSAALEALEAIHARALDAARRDFDAELAEMRAEAAAERASAAEAQRRTETELTQVIEAMEAEWRAKHAEARREFAAAMQDSKERSAEELQRVREQLDARIEASQAAFDRARREYQRDVGPLLASFGRAYEVDQQNQRTLRGNERRLARLQEAIAEWRSKLAASSAAFEREQQRLSDDRAMVAEHFSRLKQRMGRFREIQRQRLVDMSATSNAALKALDEKLALAEKVLRAAALNERLQTEEEAVLGFQTLDEAVPLPGSEFGAIDDDLAAVAEEEEERRQRLARPAPEFSSYAMTRDGAVADEVRLMESFFRVYNRAQADVEDLEREAQELRRENADLEEVLQRCQRGEGPVVDGADPSTLDSLLVINEREPPRIRVVEGGLAQAAATAAEPVRVVSIQQQSSPAAVPLRR